MKGFLQWFKSSAKMKRWMFLILLGVVLICYSVAQILVYDKIDATALAIGKIVISFVFGFLFMITGFVFLNKRTLEVFIESTDNRMENKKGVNVKSLIFNKTVYDQGPNIVVIGGGSGLSTVLSGLKNYTNNLTAIVAVSDYGEENSEAERELGLLPTEDIKNSLIALGNNEAKMKELFEYKFNTGRLNGYTFADLYFAGMTRTNKDFSDAILNSNEVLNITGKVIPVTLENIQISAELENGYVINQKSKIPEVVADKLTKINRVYITPSNCRPAPGVLEAIKNADSIIIGPGSLYTNVIPNLLVNGVAKAIKDSKAIKIYVSNIMTEQGQTDDYSVEDHINAIIDHCGEGLFDYCIYDTGEIIPEYIKMYNKEGADLVEQKIKNVKAKGIKFIRKDIAVVNDGRIRHDASLVASSVIELICNDLKFKDKQNDPQFMMLNSKLQSDKRINKIKQKQEKKTKKGKHERKFETINSKGKKSKFSTKYQERIKSIKESDEKAKNKRKNSPQANKEEEKVDIYKRMQEFRKSGYKKNG
ncbi:MAG: YvcK family protein [Clostridia bacterium]|nr:YvcK family protein [Clostridia bacterium]